MNKPSLRTSAVQLLTKEAPREALENLSYRERRVLEVRHGLGDEHPRTLDEVGRTFNVTRERIRQIENQSLKKLQNLREAHSMASTVSSRKSGVRVGSSRWTMSSTSIGCVLASV